MFCDLVGSTSISAGLDAEEWRDPVSAYLDAASAAVMEMDGHVAKKLGDGLNGAVRLSGGAENDAERATRAALSIQRSLADINRKNASSGKPELNARIGIETGPVVDDAAGEIYGDAPNTANDAVWRANHFPNSGLGRVKTKSDLVVMPSGRQIFAFFCSPHDRRAQNSGCGYTA